MSLKTRNIQVEVVKALSEHGELRLYEMVEIIYKDDLPVSPKQNVMTALTALLRRKTIVRISHGVYQLAET